MNHERSVLAKFLVDTVDDIYEAPAPTSARQHLNFAVAKRHCERLCESITNAQKTDEFHLEGRAVRARELFRQAFDELSQAAGESIESRHPQRCDGRQARSMPDARSCLREDEA